MEIIKRLLGIVDKSKEQQEMQEMIERKFDEIQQKVLAEMALLKNENVSLKGELTAKNNRVTELLTKVRDQSEADLLLECKRIEKRIIEGEKRPDIDLNRFNAIQNMQAQFSQQLAASNRQGLSGLIGGAFGNY